MPIQFETDRETDLTTFTFKGQVTLSEMLDAMNAYGKSGVTRNELYDVRQLAGDRISAEDIEAVVGYFQRYGNVRPENSKTAVLVADQLDFGISRMLQQLTEGEVPFSIGVFETQEQAMTWLQEESIQEK